MNSVLVTPDHFGVAGAHLVAALLNGSSNLRARKVAFNNLFRLAKASALIAKQAVPMRLAITVNRAGVQHLEFIYMLPGKNEYTKDDYNEERS